MEEVRLHLIRLFKLKIQCFVVYEFLIKDGIVTHDQIVSPNIISDEVSPYYHHHSLCY